MKIVVVSPASDEPREHAVLAELFSSGLERYHVRKPQWSGAKLSSWLRLVAVDRRARLVLHQHHELATEYGCGGMHFKDFEGRDNAPHCPRPAVAPKPCLFTSRSCHDLATLDSALGRFDAVFLSPVFPSISKPSYQPTLKHAVVTERLVRRTAAERRTEVIALGGITPANASCCAELGFDGLAVLGALWQATEPLKIFEQLQQSISVHAA
jgi:thiamine-phosphate pyrophosphorylase